MSELTLPPVAKSFYTFCKKCDADRYHTVLAHTTSRSAKIKCEVCGSQKTYSLPKSGTGKPTVRSAARMAASQNARRSSHEAEYKMLLESFDSNPTQSYNMKMKFELNHKLEHPKFGLGVIRSVQPDKIEVVFSDEIRNLIHNRS